MSKAKEKRYPFEPDYAVPPGKTLKELMEYWQVSRGYVAGFLSIPLKELDRLIVGKSRITRLIAENLEALAGAPAHMWLNLETNYRKQLAKLKEAGDGN